MEYWLLLFATIVGTVVLLFICLGRKKKTTISTATQNNIPRITIRAPSATGSIQGTPVDCAAVTASLLSQDAARPTSNSQHGLAGDQQTTFTVNTGAALASESATSPTDVSGSDYGGGDGGSFLY